MSISEILLLDYDIEVGNTRRTLALIPEKDPLWKPHEKSMAIGRLAVHVARLPNFCSRILSTPEMNMATDKFPELVFESTAGLLTVLDEAAAEAKSHLAASSDEDLEKKWRLLFGERVVVDAPRKVLYRVLFLNHMIHHRAQLGVYLRLLDIPVPGLYGPSADEPFN